METGNVSVYYSVEWIIKSIMSVKRNRIDL